MRFAIIVVCAATAAPAFGDLIPTAPNPAGSPIHNGVQNLALGQVASTMAPTVGYTVSLTPNPASFRPTGNCPWIIPAAQVAAQPYNTTPATDVWNFTTAANPLKGHFTLVNYEAWADNSPAVTLNGNTFGGVAEPNRGGAAFVITYQQGTGGAGPDDPLPANIHWMQVIDTNQPTARGVTYGKALGDGTTIYLDNSANSTTGAGIDPYYGRLSGFTSANGSGFLDETDFSLAGSVGINWQAQVFLTTESDVVSGAVTTHNVTIYDGVWWGFSIAVPEPSPLAMAASVFPVAMGFWWRKRRQAA